MKVIIDYKFESINNYINACRTNPFVANKIKREETNLARLHFINKTKIETYPIEIVFIWHIKNVLTDLDGKGSATKNILDGMVEAKLIENDNVKYINKISHLYKRDTSDFVEVEIVGDINHEYCAKNKCNNSCKKYLSCFPEKE